MRVGILGPLEVDSGGRHIEITGARLRALLIRLALDAGRTVSVPALADALWGDAAPADPANAVQSLVSRLRRLLPDGTVSFGPGGYRLDLPAEDVDALRFEQLARQGQRELRAGDPAGAVRSLAAALGLWRGEPLAEVADAPYAAAPAARWAELRLSAVEDRIEAELAGDGGEHLVAELEELTRVHPLRERPHALLVQALYQAGRQAEALSAYDALRDRLADQLGLDPSPQLRELRTAVLRADPALAGRKPVRRGNLRAALTSFVGREPERARIEQQLATGRLVTLVGPGGAGKTRLATTVAAEHAGRGDGAVWLVELAGVVDPIDLTQTVLAALELRELPHLESTGTPPAPRDAVSRLVEALSSPGTLVLLDNCEHIVAAVAQLADDLLSRCPRLRIVATSREPLGILGEALCPVTPLSLPEPDADVARALTFPVVELLRDRAVAVRPDFAVDEGNVAAVVEICRRLDGLPLAIELAAARLRTLSPQHVAARLDDRFRLLTGGSRTALARHRTLRAVVDWSWDLLGEQERLLAARLAVFPAGIAHDSAAGVCAGPDLPADEVPDLLDALVDRSLLQLVPAAEPRYRMLDTIREYGLEQLAAAGTLAAARGAHLAWFLELAETAEPKLRGPEQIEWIGRLVTERDNVLAALHHACDTGDADAAVRMGASLGLFWTVLGDNAEAATWLGQALAVPGPSPAQTRTLARIFHLINKAAVEPSQEGVASVMETFVKLAAEVDPEWDHPLFALVEPAMAMVGDDTEAGLAAIERRLGRADPWAQAMLLAARAFIRDNDGDADGMYADLTDAVARLRAIGDRAGLSVALTALAEAELVRGRGAAAVGLLHESISLVRQLSSDDDSGYARMRLAAMRVHLGEYDAARADLRELARGGNGRDVCGALLTLGDLARYQDRLDEAGEYYAAAKQQVAETFMVSPQFLALIGTSVAHLTVARRDLDTARAELASALVAGVQVRDMPVVAKVGVAVADYWLAVGEPERAGYVLGAAERIRGVADRGSPDAVRVSALVEADPAGRSGYARGRDLDRPQALTALDL
ncbi:BTAD domain-containing putative transcriptional regulator [Catellatospora sp. KI3]|uniref:ATP-binding protein n=1 Tax=Catellatospora sp. KI3 TaxID=3041620 RepID=UPI002482C0E6|nr:BTAD domain-containing putative transcriptional regulator [Catellatospora sp. KI3]MDI1462520.1 BTAD domain-containing putative transcriptional regulator [Catellatospora sp. KI3]